MEPRSISLRGAHGLSLHALEWSNEGVLMLLVHGFSNEAHIWDDFAPGVAEYYRTVAVDLRGHGDSDWDPEGRYDYPDHVADLEAVIDTLGGDRVVLVGHSLGGRACTLYAGAHPEKVAGFVIVDSAPELDRRGTLRIQNDVEGRKDPSFASVAEYETAISLAYPAATPAAIRRMAQHGVKPREDGRFVLKMDTAFRKWRQKPEEMKEREERLTREMWDALAKLTCPVLVVRGAASDVLSADVADRMAEDVIPNAQLAVVPQASHSVMTDNPVDFSRMVNAFVLGE